MKLRYALLISALLANYCYANPPVNLEGWYLYKMGSVELYSDMHVDVAEEILSDFSSTKLAIDKLLRAPIASTLKPFTLYIFERNSDYTDLVGHQACALFNTPDSRNSSIVIWQIPRQSSLNTLLLFNYHYAQHLMHIEKTYDFPQWFSVGAGLFYATLEEKRGNFTLGGLSRYQISILEPDPKIRNKLLPIDILLAPRHKKSLHNKTGFHFTSLLLTHYLFLGHHNGFSDKTGQLTHYLALTNTGITSEQAFEQAFSLTLDELEVEFKRYTMLRSFPVITLPIITKKNPHIEKAALEPAQVAMLLHPLAVDRSNHQLAQNLLNFAHQKHKETKAQAPDKAY
ncbi:hypothetical protein L1F30_04210 [Simiduia sp. 21SJ11W-1]|uniref:hypothetical protein n=1 Tax=Simiduia sp. 21SJ11W-1 TaxID=2909669 RepID=UPI00209C8B10|nr:hypothetical protein [Simiduia sp. 21SJ11W-1]UTA48752.1 hypothetical protein L1F30_04210 [Simiduia sp. 21SJ11W-1]